MTKKTDTPKTEVPNKSAAPNRDTFGRFLPGNPGSSGRPLKKHCVSDLMYELLTKDPDEVIKKWNEGPKTGAMKVAHSWYKKLATSDMTALKEALDRVEGKVPTPIVGANDQPLIPRPIVFQGGSEKLRKAIDELQEGEL